MMTVCTPSWIKPRKYRWSSEGLIFNPFINGAPYWRPYLKGAFIGISPGHKLGHFVRAAQEGAACALKDGMDDLEKYGSIRIKECVVTGGGGKSRVWTQMIANLLDKELIITPAADACTGAALMGAAGIGLDQYELINGLWDNYTIERVVPDEDKDDNMKLYQQYSKVHNFWTDFSGNCLKHSAAAQDGKGKNDC